MWCLASQMRWLWHFLKTFLSYVHVMMPYIFAFLMPYIKMAFGFLRQSWTGSAWLRKKILGLYLTWPWPILWANVKMDAIIEFYVTNYPLNILNMISVLYFHTAALNWLWPWPVLDMNPLLTWHLFPSLRDTMSGFAVFSSLASPWAVGKVKRGSLNIWPEIDSAFQLFQ